MNQPNPKDIAAALVPSSGSNHAAYFEANARRLLEALLLARAAKETEDRP